jgi:hypothetical protein
MVIPKPRKPYLGLRDSRKLEADFPTKYSREGDRIRNSVTDHNSSRSSRLTP